MDRAGKVDKRTYLENSKMVSLAPILEAEICDNPHLVTRGLNSQSGSLTLQEVEADQPPNEPSETLSPQGQIGIHWLRGTVHHRERAWLIDRLKLYFGTEYEELERGFWSYDRILRWPSGVMLLFNSTEEGLATNNGRIAVEIPGFACDLLSTMHLGQLMWFLDKHQFQCARFDLYYDDYRRRITPRALYNTVYELPDDDAGPAIRNDFQRFRVITPGWKGKGKQGLIENMVTFGRRGSFGSGAFLRIYDKWLESRGLVNAIRYEIELCQLKAKRAFADVVDAFGMDSDGAAMLRKCGRIIGGSIDFCKRTDRAGDKNLERLERFSWWQSILTEIGQAKLAGKKVIRTIEKAVEWVDRQVIGTLQMISTAKGKAEYVAHIVEKCIGQDRLRLHHQRTIDEYNLVQSRRDEYDRAQSREWSEKLGIVAEPVGFVR